MTRTYLMRLPPACCRDLPDVTGQWERFGTNEDPRGRPLAARAPRPTPFLSADERALYEQLIDPVGTRNRRIEQERIPLAVAAGELIRLRIPRLVPAEPLLSPQPHERSRCGTRA